MILYFRRKMKQSLCRSFLENKNIGIQLFEMERRKRYKKIQNADIFTTFE
jgi:hypothetical protein